MASTMASHMLAVCPTPFERTHLLRLLAEDSFGDGYKCNGEEGSGRGGEGRGGEGTGRGGEGRGRSCWSQGERTS